MWWVVPVHGKLTTVHASTQPAGAFAGPFNLQSQAQQWITDNGSQGFNPLNPLGQTPLAGSLVPKPSNPLTGLNAIGDFFQRLSQASTWIRVGEFAAGGILLYIGLKAFFPTAVNTATSAAKRAGKAAMFL